MATHDLSRTTGVYLLHPRHAAGIHALASDPAIAATTRIPHPYPENAAAEFVAAQAKAREEGTAAQFAIEDRGRLVGVCGLAGIEGGVARELGYWVGKPFWGRGYATFAVGVVLDFAFRNLGLREVRARADESNAASRRVLEKSGLRLVGRETGEDPRRKRPEEPLCVYSITAGEWRGLRDGPALSKLHPGLRRILDAELGADNEIAETRLGWPDAGSVLVRLKHPFRAARGRPFRAARRPPLVEGRVRHRVPPPHARLLRIRVGVQRGAAEIGGEEQSKDCTIPSPPLLPSAPHTSAPPC